MKRRLSRFGVFILFAALALLLSSCALAQAVVGGDYSKVASNVFELIRDETDPYEDEPSQSSYESPSADTPSDEGDTSADADASVPDERGTYTSKDELALYIHVYGHLPDNFITKNEARDLGWSGGSLEPYAPGYCIGGDRFGNNEGLLPRASGRQYYECDVDTLGEDSRGAKRIVYSNDGLVYYTEDHYESFELLYGGD